MKSLLTEKFKEGMEFPIRLYDKDGNKIYYESIIGYYIHEFDDNNNEIYYEDSDGLWTKREYDSNNKEVYSENQDGVIFDNKPKLNMNIKISKEPDGFPIATTLSRLRKEGNFPIKIMDGNDNLVYSEKADGTWGKSVYDDKGNKIRFEDDKGNWCKISYDDNGNNVYYKNSDGLWTSRVYDSDNNIIRYERSDRGLVYDISTSIEQFKTKISNLLDISDVQH